VLLLFAACSRVGVSVPAEIALRGARGIAFEGEERVYVFDEEHPPYFTATAPLPDVTVAGQGARLTSTTTRAAGVIAHVELPAVEQGFIEVGARRWRFRVVPARATVLDDLRTRARLDPYVALEALEARIAELRGWPLLEAHVLRCATFRLLGDAASRLRATHAWAQAAERTGVVTEQARALRSAAFQEFEARRFSQANALLSKSAELTASVDDDQGRVMVAYYRALVWAELGQYRRALRETDEAIVVAEAGGFEAEARWLAKAQVASLLEVGRYEDAWARLEQIADDAAEMPDFERAGLAVDRSWVLARGMNAGAFERDWSRVERELESALELARIAKQGHLLQIAQTNLLYVRYLTGDYETCRALLSSMAAGRLPGHVEIFVRLMRGHLDRLAGRRAAAEHYRVALRRALAESGGAPSDLTWRAHYGLARVLEGDAVARHYTAAMAHLESVTRQTELTRDRARFLDDRRQLFVDAVDALVAAGRSDLALVTADRSRALAFRSLYDRVALDALDESTRLEWRRTLDRYQAARATFERRAREAELLGADERERFVAETRRQRAALEATFSDAFAAIEQRLIPSPAELDRIVAALGPDDGLLVPWTDGARPLWFGLTRAGARVFDSRPTAPWWNGAGIVYVATMGAADPWSVLGTRAEARAWLERLPVAFIPYPSLLVSPRVASDAPPVVVADATATLPGARSEGAMVAERLGDAVLLTDEAATRDGVLDAIADTRHFHFAGHGTLNAEDPWSVHLVLAKQQRLTVEDLFATRPRATTVVLSGCATGVAARIGRTFRIGLADAFLASGARAVVATTRDVVDGTARAFVERFYAAGGATVPVRALRTAALQASGDDWASFFVVGGGR
jgi:hypothetical protein